ncbi:Photosystem I subunit H2 [Hibiscus syriacus]|uniref:Photosystem I subunit H2 n=1 Tax=Hibiscus syriacus TaxID=106335 RepID=A0A6A2WGM0_HIBSY|nr:Photosystem I subunit H2 [Hibiscus syriacus]
MVKEQDNLWSHLISLRSANENKATHAKSLSIDSACKVDEMGSNEGSKPSSEECPKMNLTMEEVIAAFQIREKQLLTDMEQMKEKFAKLLLGEDVWWRKGSFISFSTVKRLYEPCWKARWRKEIDWLLSVADHVVELVPSQQKSKDGTNMEIMVTKQRIDLHMNIPALRKLDTMLIGKNKRKDDKWWLPTVKVPQDGLSDKCRKNLQSQKESVTQVLKAAMSINAQVLSEIEVPENYIEALPKAASNAGVRGGKVVGCLQCHVESSFRGRPPAVRIMNCPPWDSIPRPQVSLGDAVYRSITVEFFDPDQFFSSMDLSSEHKIIDLKNRLEASIVIWKRKMTQKDGKSAWGSAVSFEKREQFEERAETILLIIKHRFPGLPQSSLDISKIQYNRYPVTLVVTQVIQEYWRAWPLQSCLESKMSSMPIT